MKRKIVIIILVLISLILIITGTIYSFKNKKTEPTKNSDSVQISCTQNITLTELIEEEYRDIQANITYIINYKNDEYNTTYTYEYKYKDINDYKNHNPLETTGATTETDEISLTKKNIWKNVYFTTVNTTKEKWYNTTKKDLESLGYTCTIKN